MISLLKKRTKKITITSACKSAWYSGKGAQNKMFDNADQIGHKFYIVFKELFCQIDTISIY